METLDILDMCCSVRSTWFDKSNPRVVYIDIRRETHQVTRGKGREDKQQLQIEPTCIADFQKLPFANDTFKLVLFDPPHTNIRYETIIAKHYGRLPGDWKSQYRNAFHEGFRVLQQGGILIFKWATNDIPLAQVLELTDYKPLLGHKTAKTTHWVTFIKPCRATTQ